jgi:hypothetical protein
MDELDDYTLACLILMRGIITMQDGKTKDPTGKEKNSVDKKRKVIYNSGIETCEGTKE